MVGPSDGRTTCHEMNRDNRLTGILLALQGGRTTVVQFAERFEASRLTIPRDMDALSRFRVTVVALSGVGGGYDAERVGAPHLSRRATTGRPPGFAAGIVVENAGGWIAFETPGSRLDYCARELLALGPEAIVLGTGTLRVRIIALAEATIRRSDDPKNDTMVSPIAP